MTSIEKFPDESSCTEFCCQLRQKTYIVDIAQPGHFRLVRHLHIRVHHEVFLGPVQGSGDRGKILERAVGPLQQRVDRMHRAEGLLLLLPVDEPVLLPLLLSLALLFAGVERLGGLHSLFKY